MHFLGSGIDIIEHGTLRQFNFKAGRIDLVAVYDFTEGINKIWLLELLGTDIHRQAQVTGFLAAFPLLDLGAGGFQYP